MSRQLHIPGVIALVAIASAGPASALAAEPADLLALEQAWHRCLRETYAHQPAGQSRAEQRNALDECKDREDAHVAALMAAGPAGANKHQPSAAGVRTWAAYLAFVVDPVRAWIERCGADLTEEPG